MEGTTGTISTAVSPPPFHVQRTKAFVHYDTVSALWEKKWKFPCSNGIYPFMDGKLEDFEPIFAKLVELSGDDAQFLYDPDRLADPFLPVARSLIDQGKMAEEAGQPSAAKDFYFRAGAVCRIARFPIIRSEQSRMAWEMNKEAYRLLGKYLDPPNQEISIPFTYLDTQSGDQAGDIQAYLRVPKSTPPPAGWPVLLFICGLDAYRTDNTPRVEAHLNAGFAVVIFEIPGTGDCPASRGDPESPDRLMSSIINWVHSNAVTYNFDVEKICARGISTGGYYALRVAHTHADKLFAVVAQGGGAHYMFHPKWIENMDKMEYPYALAEALACKFGHGSGDVAGFIASDPMSKYSLLKPEIAGKESCRMLIINGMEDSIFPVEDSILVGMTGKNEDLILRANLAHMGNPGAEEILGQWLEDIVKT